MTLQAEEILKAAAQELWAETPSMRAQYDDKFETYWVEARAWWLAKQEWSDPKIKREFGGNFDSYLAFKRAEAAGHVRVMRGAGSPTFTAADGRRFNDEIAADTVAWEGGLREEWRINSRLRQEFVNFEAYLAFKKAEAKGLVQS